MFSLEKERLKGKSTFQITEEHCHRADSKDLFSNSPDSRPILNGFISRRGNIGGIF